MKFSKDHIWALVGLGAVVFSAWLLYHQVRHLSLDDVLASLTAISASNWLWACLATVGAYIALAGYDQLALRHLGKKISATFVFACSFTTYALGHNIGASVVSGGLVRYRAYSSQGLSAPEVGVLVAFCSLTFALGAMLLGGFALLGLSHEFDRLFPGAPQWVPIAAGLFLLLLVGLYVLGSWREFKPLRIRNFSLCYPRLPIVARQLIIGPLELLAAAAIIYFALPEASNPGYWMVLGIFLASFSAALVSHAPGGLGVLELIFLLALPDVDPADVLAALLVFRLLYLLIPFAVSLVIVLLFERSQLRRTYLNRTVGSGEA